MSGHHCAKWGTYYTKGSHAGIQRAKFIESRNIPIVTGTLQLQRPANIDREEIQRAR